jgi:cell division septation protein DedD
MRQIDQRISIRHELKPLNAKETAAYVAHRLAIAGGGASVSFEPKALELVHKYTAGIPRPINLLCDRALLGGYAARTNRITPEIVTAAAAGLELIKPRFAIGTWLHHRTAAFAAGAAVMALLAAAIAYGVIAIQAGTSTIRPVDGGRAAAADAKTSAPAPAPAPTVPTAVVDPPPLATTDQQSPIAESTSGRTAAAPVSRPQTPSYSVLVGSFRRDSEVTALVRQLQDLGFRVRSSRVESGDRGAWHQVFVGPYSDLEEARRDVARVQRMPGYSDARLITY